MVVKMMRWRPWPPLISRKFEVNLNILKLEGGEDWVHEGVGGVAVEIKWKGPKISLSTFRRTTLKRNCTREENIVDKNGSICWDEEFQSVVNFSGFKDNVFHPWEISFNVLCNGLPQGAKNKLSLVGTATLNLAELAARTEEKEFQLAVPLSPSNSATESRPSLSISISLVELRAAQESSESMQRPVVTSSSPPPPAPVETPPAEKDELSALKAGLRKVKILTEYVSIRRAKKACRVEESSEGRCSTRSEECEYAYPFDSDSNEEFEGGESDESKEDSTVRKSFSYGTLAYANYVGGSFYSSTKVKDQDEDWIYYSHRKPDVCCSHAEESLATSSEPPILQNSKRSILPWRKRKMSFRSPKTKGEPLLKKDNGEEGGDDIDYDRRQLSSDESLAFGWQKTDEDSSVHRSSISEFGDDNFAVGNWEQKEITSRDGQMKLQTQVFFASIDQRSERAAGESACTALVAVVADWLQSNRGLMPVKSQFDSLIREGSFEWRKLCENDEYRRRFPDKHFDLETILQAKIRSISVVPGKSFIGFFHADGMDEGKLDFLHGSMSFDNIWDEISGADCLDSNEPQVYIVSWNDHFFVLKVEPEAYYIIDTLGERLHEGCNQAYVLKFGRDTTIFNLPSKAQSQQEKPATELQIVPAGGEHKNMDTEVCPNDSRASAHATTGSDAKMQSEEEEVLCQGKECCKEYIKSFLAAIPIRELQADIKRGLITSTPVHHRLQIEFHFTRTQEPAPVTHAIEAATARPQMAEVEVAAG
ncbi:hypothetical protein LIER_18946 [Lithospermum erythrorhizon]|uniref:C2 NT-type domain-containing protein n=1 Tax=Lithospermum erythrorhizon TaxID=34254 RepID=A0AAV3QKA6_LITER